MRLEINHIVVARCGPNHPEHAGQYQLDCVCMEGSIGAVNVIIHANTQSYATRLANTLMGATVLVWEEGAQIYALALDARSESAD